MILFLIIGVIALFVAGYFLGCKVTEDMNVKPLRRNRDDLQKERDDLRDRLIEANGRIATAKADIERARANLDGLDDVIDEEWPKP